MRWWLPLVFCVVPSLASAVPITYALTGTVTSVALSSGLVLNDWLPGVAVGPWAGTLVIDRDVPPSSDGLADRFFGAVETTVDIGPQRFVSQAELLGHDTLSAAGFRPQIPTATRPGINGDSFVLTLFAVPPDIDDLTGLIGTVGFAADLFGDFPETKHLHWAGTVDSVQRVPEPGTILLLLSAAIMGVIYLSGSKLLWSGCG